MKADVHACEALYFSAHHNAALSAMCDHASAPTAPSVTRAAIVSWYYALYTSARAMVLATSGHNPDKHATLIRVWHDDVAKRGLAHGPFGLRLDTLVNRDTKGVVAAYRATATGSLQKFPKSLADAQGAIVEYLNGTADYERWKCATRVRRETSFKALGVKDFKTKAARDLLAVAHARGAVNFMTQAYRFRGKANYRDSLFLSYGSTPTIDTAQFLRDLSSTAAAFSRMAAALVSRRLPPLTWKAFVQDVDLNARMPVDRPSLGLVA